MTKGKLFYSAEGLAGYDSALLLGLRSVIADEPVKGEISIATTGLGDPAAFARVQAGTLDPTRRCPRPIAATMPAAMPKRPSFSLRSTAAGDAPLSTSEALANEALQKSNLGRYAEADALFSRASEVMGTDPIVVRRLRNYRAMHELNQGQAKAALAELDKPLPRGSEIASRRSRAARDR